MPRQISLNELLKSGSKSEMPSSVSPMLATLVDEPFHRDNRTYEIKWDGYRAISYIDYGAVVIFSKNNKSFGGKYFPIADSLKKWKAAAVIYGKILVIDETRKANFNAMQNWRSEAKGLTSVRFILSI